MTGEEMGVQHNDTMDYVFFSSSLQITLRPWGSWASDF
jgi:hypothetical protein